MVTVNKTRIDMMSPHCREVEIAFPRGIKNHNIVGVTTVYEDGSYKGYSTPKLFRM